MKTPKFDLQEREKMLASILAKIGPQDIWHLYVELLKKIHLIKLVIRHLSIANYLSLPCI